MDTFFRIDVDDILRSVDRAEAMTFFFPILGKVLLIDTRHNEREGPLVRIVPMVSSVEERVRNIERMRPSFGRPESITTIPWLRYVASFESLGVLDRLCRRLNALGWPECDHTCTQALEELKRCERREILAAIRGEGYKALWERC
ncbi:MAG: hypothetical protein HYX89_03175 [Chloroflexi bacterium]|nr:hypothetical protein [Chloroflexota bacterium]